MSRAFGIAAVVLLVGCGGDGGTIPPLAAREQGALARVDGAASVSVEGDAAGVNLSQLQREWWQWAMATPVSQSPIYDDDGSRCGMAQRGTTWYLAGTSGGTSIRHCTIPAGVRLFIPVVNTFCFPDESYSDAFCVTDTDAFIESFRSEDLRLTVDGRPVPVTDVRDATDFRFAVGADGVFGTPAGVYRATIARGYWGLVRELRPGAHLVEISATGPDFSLAVTYHLQVVVPTN